MAWCGSIGVPFSQLIVLEVLIPPIVPLCTSGEPFTDRVNRLVLQRDCTSQTIVENEWRAVGQQSPRAVCDLKLHEHVDDFEWHFQQHGQHIAQKKGNRPGRRLYLVQIHVGVDSLSESNSISDRCIVRNKDRQTRYGLRLRLEFISRTEMRPCYISCTRRAFGGGEKKGEQKKGKWRCLSHFKMSTVAIDVSKHPQLVNRCFSTVSDCGT